MKTLIVFVILILSSRYAVFSQDSIYPKYIIENLCSNRLAGRGYVNHGDSKAARFIAKELKKMQLKPLFDDYYQKFSFPMNTFPGTMVVSLDGISLIPVAQYVVSPDCNAVDGTFDLVYLPQSCDTSNQVFDSLKKVDYSNKIVVAPFKKRDWKTGNPFQSAGWIIPKESIYWWASTGHEVAESPLLFIHDSIIMKKPQTITWQIKNKFIDRYQTQNVMGYIEGRQIADSFIVFTAHYDHLGMMGKDNVFKGANDNASGTAMVLNLANYFSKVENKPKYSIAFLLFSGEESGLLGSLYYSQNPAFPLKQIKALVNLDMVGSGSEGISIVNGEANPNIANQLKSINSAKNYFSDIRVGGESCNSDHCYFHQAGVPAVFIFTRGAECKEYHNLKDVPETLPLTKFSQLEKLLIDWVNQ